MDEKVLRQLEIKSKCVERTMKEYTSYIDEVQIEKDKLEYYEYLHEFGNGWKTRQQREVLKQAETMVPHSKKRLEGYVKDLKSYMGKEMKEGVEEFEKAMEILKKGESVLKSPPKAKTREEREKEEFLKKKELGKKEKE